MNISAILNHDTKPDPDRSNALDPDDECTATAGAVHGREKSVSSSDGGTLVVPAQQSATGRDAVEMVMDLNTNVVDTLPAAWNDHPKTQEQVERLMAVRYLGACEEHRKKSRRCTCYDKKIEIALRGFPSPELTNQDGSDRIWIDSLRRETGSTHCKSSPFSTFAAVVPHLWYFEDINANIAKTNLNQTLAQRLDQNQYSRLQWLAGNKQRHAQAVRERNCKSAGKCSAQEWPAGAYGFRSSLPLPTEFPATSECPLCFEVKEFATKVEWMRHFYADLQTYICTFPGCPSLFFFQKKADLREHERRHQELVLWQCRMSDCKTKFFNKAHFVRHLKAGKHDIWSKSDIDRFVKECYSVNQWEQEPCHFCGTISESWPKFIQHKFKHLELDAWEDWKAFNDGKIVDMGSHFELVGQGCEK
ncbi:hypothetical protein AJ80_08820 [Polytolypa hystricis UAMH7299]|uniref:C2H2-type domain-containing protein n=1 Tax=Polytolypa hystricis (strain UAMH7299) TaxID=1447883 RepID=A0A2B7X1M7_POLH7|nr:hypothetical protein AJ80_08820 [Polytolypa hystricis UAMH7299]